MMAKEGSEPWRFAHLAMGTTFELFVAGEERSYSLQASQAVFSEIDRLERLFSRFDPSSDIGQINGLTPGGSVRVGVETYECLRTALWAFEVTSGAFDIHVPSLTSGGGRALPEILELRRTPEGFVAGVSPTGEAERSAPLELDLGGIGKGYALDRAAEILVEWGIKRALVHGGTSTALALGAPGKEGARSKGWAVRVGGDWECPEAPREVWLCGRALSGSGTEVKGPHIIDPRSGEAASGHLAAWVGHTSAAVADALSTAFVVMGHEEVRRFCREHPEVWAMVITPDGEARVFNRDAMD
ncbi:MAG: FAD:protein FMN transferase [Candidatus Aminicenantales bacterium]